MKTVVCSDDVSSVGVFFCPSDFCYGVILDFYVCGLPVCFRFGVPVREAEFFPCSRCLCSLHFILFDDGNWGVDCEGKSLLFDGVQSFKLIE